MKRSKGAQVETWLVVDPGKVCGFVLWQVDEGAAHLVTAGVVFHSFALRLFQLLAPSCLVMESSPTSTRLSWKGQAKLLEDLSHLEAEVVEIPAAAWKGGRFDRLAHRRSDQTAILGDHLRDAIGLSRFAFHRAGRGLPNRLENRLLQLAGGGDWARGSRKGAGNLGRVWRGKANSAHQENR